MENLGFTWIIHVVTGVLSSHVWIHYCVRVSCKDLFHKFTPSCKGCQHISFKLSISSALNSYAFVTFLTVQGYKLIDIKLIVKAISSNIDVIFKHKCALHRLNIGWSMLSISHLSNDICNFSKCRTSESVIAWKYILHFILDLYIQPVFCILYIQNKFRKYRKQK